MRIALQDLPILERRRFALVAVDGEIAGLLRLLGHEGPFHAGPEAGAAAPAQAGILDHLLERFGLHLAPGLLRHLVPADREVVVDRAARLAVGRQQIALDPLGDHRDLRFARELARVVGLQQALNVLKCRAFQVRLVVHLNHGRRAA